MADGPLYKLDEWEHNGRDDSDWYAIVYNPESDSIERIETGTTRFPDALHLPICKRFVDKDFPAAVEKRIHELLSNMWFARLRRLEDQRVNEPGPDELEPGTKVRLISGVRNHQKKVIPGDKCHKCNGTGNWVNPNNSSDKRTCFTCKGKGHFPKYEKQYNEAGKPIWEKTPAGTKGEVIRTEFYGQTYRNGYNRPNRENMSVFIRLEDGREIRVAMKKLGLDETPRTDEEIRKVAESRAKNEGAYRFYRTAGIRL